MPILKGDFAAALVLDQEIEQAVTQAETQREVAKTKRVELQAAIKAFKILDAKDPLPTALVEHDGAVYRVTETDIFPLVPTVTTT